MGSEEASRLVEANVVAFTAQKLSVRREKLSTNTRLAQDLGMDGDDAVDIFNEFGSTFGVDLHGLHANWERHFLQEGGPSSLGAMVVICGCVTAGFLLRDLVGTHYKRAPLRSRLRASVQHNLRKEHPRD